MKSYHYIPKHFRLFDVSLRDGLQTWRRIPTLHEKKIILHNIIKNTNTIKIEIGSIVSKKRLPQFEDSIELYHYAKKKYSHIIPYILIPNLKAQEIALHNQIYNMSFITSISESFQKKNTNMDINQTKLQLNSMISKSEVGYKKIYVSCVNQCPISGIIDNKTIIRELMDYIVMPVDEICISDTCGTLTKDIFHTLYTELVPLMIKENIPISKLSLHLHKHRTPGKTHELIKYCINNELYNFDVSCIEGGGCSVTMKECQINKNVSYDDFNW